MKEPTEGFADQLGRYLVRAGFIQQELAHKIGMHRNTIVKWMNRTSRPTSCGQVLRLADELSLMKEERKAFSRLLGFRSTGGQQKCGRSPCRETCFLLAVTKCSAPYESCSSREARWL